MNAILSEAGPAALVAAGSPVWIGKFTGSGALPAPWRVVQIDKKTKATSYRLATLAGVTAVEAPANDSIALLARPLSM